MSESPRATSLPPCPPVPGGCSRARHALAALGARKHADEPAAYDESFSLHGSTMLFLVAVPAMAFWRAADAREVGPDLPHIGNRSELAGRLPNDPGAMVRWLTHPQAISAGSGMPEQAVSAADARDMAAFLYSQK